MRRRMLALLCVLALCVTVQIPTRASANGEVFFTAVNETVLPLSAGTMPVWSGGLLYVPYTVFDVGSTGISLGTSSLYSRSSNTVSIFTLRQTMVFDMNEGVCRNYHTGETVPGQAILRNGRPYVPVVHVCSFFGFNSPTYLTTSYGSLVRITNANRILSDADFLDAGSDTFRNRYRDYTQSLQSQEGSKPSEQSPTPNPNPDPAANPVYVAVRGGDESKRIAAVLEQSGGVGVFFFPAQELGTQGALVRCLLGSGHSVGILADGESTAQTLELLDQGQRALETVAHTRTYLAIVPDSQRQALEEDGWVCWQTGVEPETDSAVGIHNRAQGAVRALSRSNVPHLTLDGSADSADVLGSMLPQMNSQGYVITAPRETQL